MYGPNLKLFGITASGEKVFSIMLKNKDLACEIMTYGATVHTLFVPRSDGGMVDVVLGYDTLEEYERTDILARRSAVFQTGLQVVDFS